MTSYNNTKIIEKCNITTQIDADGKESQTILETTQRISRSNEPNYIKIYTDMWCEFNEIPERFRQLFLSLAARMSYANGQDARGSQLVNTCKPWSEAIIEECGWKTEADSRGRMKGQISLDKGLKELCRCNAIRRVGRGIYQINPSYAGKGEWKYNPRMHSGGIEDLVSTFSFKNHEVDTKIIWADDGTEETKDFRENVGKGAVLKSVTATPKTMIHY